MRQYQWQDRFSIGVDVIDQAHHRLFLIVQKIMDLYVERHEDKFACIEGIKYFKAYALKHFAEEEAYMRKIGYPGYQAHKKIHDRMRWETLPELERLLYDSNFSTEMVQRFIGVCTGWLTGHILIEDRAISGFETGELLSAGQDGELSVIHAVILRPLQEVFGSDIQYIGQFSTKDEILNAQYYELIYSTREGKRLRIILVIGEEILIRAAGMIFGMDFFEMNDIVCFAIQEIAQHLIQRAEASFGIQPDKYQLEADRFLEHEKFITMFQEHPPQHSLLFHAKQECFALCIDQSQSPVPESSETVREHSVIS